MGKGHILAPLERIKNIEKNGGGSTANVKDVIIPLLVDNWEFNEENNTYSQVAIVNGLTDSSNPVILLSSANEQATEEEVNAYICIKESLVADGSITFVADQKPSISISVIVKNVIASNSTVAGDVTDLVNKMNELEAEIDELKVSLKDIAIPLLANEWILDETENVWKQTATIVGLPADSNPIIVLSPENEDPTEDELNCFDCLLDETIIEEGQITFVASEAPLFSFTVIAKGVMASDNQAIADVTALVAKVNGLENEIDRLNGDLADIVLLGTLPATLTAGQEITLTQPISNFKSIYIELVLANGNDIKKVPTNLIGINHFISPVLRQGEAMICVILQFLNFNVVKINSVHLSDFATANSWLNYASVNIYGCNTI